MAIMKGQSELTKAYIFLAVLLVFISFAINPLYGMINAGVKNNARLQAREIAGIINVMKASPGNIDYRIDVSGSCKIEINDRFVTYTINPDKTPVSSTVSLIEGETQVENKDVACNSCTLTLRKIDNKITVTTQ
ncbi:MAG: hypothetical protein NT120_02380 [Candidatus Aenigmarchaeota archaeon]|nr:hypothetical protein [Candidatus Aenigmarchaeota archaeon]